MASSSVKLSRQQPPGTRSAERDLGHSAAHWGLPVLVVLCILVVWQVATVLFKIPSFLVPSPVTIAKTLWTSRSEIASNVLPTVEEAAAGFFLGNAIALVLATWFVHVRTARRALYPLAIVIQSIPIVALAPIFVVALGEGFSSKVAMTTLICFFPTLVNATRGLDAVDKPLIELFQSVHASRRDIFFKLRLPSALPYIFLGLRITASASVIGAIIAEWIGAEKGLGYLVINSTYEFNAPLLWATLVASSALVLCAFGLTALVERWVVPWRVSAEAASRPGGGR